MAEVRGLKQLVGQLQARAATARRDAAASAVVGYTAAYSVFVHEDLQAAHPNGGQAKFLEQPARELKSELAGVVREMLLKRKTMAQALLVAGLRLQRESQLLVPVETGNLRASAFTRVEEG